MSVRVQVLAQYTEGLLAPQPAAPSSLSLSAREHVKQQEQQQEEKDEAAAATDLSSQQVVGLEVIARVRVTWG